LKKNVEKRRVRRRSPDASNAAPVTITCSFTCARQRQRFKLRHAAVHAVVCATLVLGFFSKRGGEDAAGLVRGEDGAGLESRVCVFCEICGVVCVRRSYSPRVYYVAGRDSCWSLHEQALEGGPWARQGGTGHWLSPHPSGVRMMLLAVCTNPSKKQLVLVALHKPEQKAIGFSCFAQTRANIISQLI